MNQETEPNEEARFRILVCIDGSEESFRGVRYAARLGRKAEADIVLLYIRSVDHGMGSGGLQVRVAHENMLNWGLELPGLTYLKKGRDLLVEIGYMAPDRREEFTHMDVAGDPLGDNTLTYHGKHKRKILLKLKVASDITTGILKECEGEPYDMVILGASERWRRRRVEAFWDPAVAEKVAVHAPCSVLVARELEIGSGHLICTDGSERAQEMVRRDAILASRCECAISLISVALDTEDLPKAEENVDKAVAMLESMNIDVEETMTRAGDPVEEIIDAGLGFSLIVLSDTGMTGLKRFFMGSVAFQVLEHAHTSVLIIR